MDTLGKRLKELREENSFTLEYVATKLNTTKTSIARYEKNDREPKSEMLTALANFYNVSVDYLLGRTDERNIHKEKPKLDEGIKTIAAHRVNPYEDISEEGINKINEYIEMVRMMEQNKNK